MKSNKKRTLKVIAGIVAALLVGGILFLANAFVGNPISAMIANKEIKNYVYQHYSYLDLEVEKAVYNFKDSSYVAKAKSNTSIDTHFYINYRNTKMIWDDYESAVLGKYNTIQRLEDEYSNTVRMLIANELGYERNNTRVLYDADAYEQKNDLFELDMPFDKELTIDSQVNIQLDLPDPSLEVIAAIFTKAHQVFIDQDVQFSEYSLSSESAKKLVMINGITPAHIDSGNLVSLLNDAGTIANEAENEEGITVYTNDIK